MRGKNSYYMKKLLSWSEGKNHLRGATAGGGVKGSPERVQPSYPENFNFTRELKRKIYHCCETKLRGMKLGKNRKY